MAQPELRSGGRTRHTIDVILHPAGGKPHQMAVAASHRDGPAPATIYPGGVTWIKIDPPSVGPFADSDLPHYRKLRSYPAAALPSAPVGGR